MQIEYAMENINKQVPAVGIRTDEGIVLGAEKKEKQKLRDDTHEMGKMFKIDDHCLCAVSGSIGDANYLIEEARYASQQHFYTYSSHMPVESIVQALCAEKHSYTQFGSYRPMGVSLMYAGYDKLRKYQLYSSDPSGNYSSWKAQATGENNVNAMATLKADFKEDLTLKDALKLAIKVVSKSIDTHDPKPEKFEIAYLTQEEGELVQKELTNEEVTEFLAILKKEQEDEEKKD